MSDLSASFLPSSAAISTSSVELRGAELRGADSPAAVSNSGEGSFSSVLTKQVAKNSEGKPSPLSTDRHPSTDKASPPADKASTAATDPALDSVESAATANLATETTETDDVISADSPLATVMIQLLLPGAQGAISAGKGQTKSDAAPVDLAAEVDLDASETATTGTGQVTGVPGIAILTPSATGPDLPVPLFRTVASGPLRSGAESLPGQALATLTDANEGGVDQSGGSDLPGTGIAVQEAGGKSASSFGFSGDGGGPAITAEANVPVNREVAVADDSKFSQLLVKAQETQAATQSSNTADTSVRMQHPAGHANWSNELGDKLTWMVTSQRQQADLVLNPPQLGRIEVSLTVSGDQANAVFTSPNAAVREMIENSLPRLREILAGSGLNLGQADVGAQSFSQQRGENSSSGNASSERGLRADNSIDAAGLAGVTGSLELGRPGARRGLVDTFA